MGLRVNIVVACTQRKALSVSSRLCLREILAADTSRRVQAWLARLNEGSESRVPAMDLYCGDHWSVVRSIAAVPWKGGITPRVWVCSAGYGLVRAASLLCPYSATFSANKPDSVTRGMDTDDADKGRQRWWELLARWGGPEPGQPRSLAELVRRYRQDALVIAASDVYLRALREDLVEARVAHPAPERLILVSAGLRRFGNLTEHLLPCDVRLRKALKGSCHSLNVRIVRKLLQESEQFPLDMRLLRPRYQQNLSKLPPFAHVERQPVTDKQVSALIAAALRCNPTETHTRLLRKLRDSGRACEQKRFAAIFRATRGVCNAKT